MRLLSKNIPIMPFPTPLMTPEDDCQHIWLYFSPINSLTSGDKNVFHDCDMFAPFSGLPHGGEGEEAEEKSVVKVWRYRVASARIRDGRCDWLQAQGSDGPQPRIEFRILESLRETKKV
jgi:hypothetical protein